jgi:ParB family chromosome partitioning protein
MAKVHVSHNSGNNEWYTPPDLVEAARSFMGAFDCDPASSAIANRTIQADRFYTVEDDGLRQPTWGGRVWMNPPYAQPLITSFSADLARRYRAGEVHEACVLVNNATETGWFHALMSEAAAVCLIRGRVRFMDPAGQPSGAPLQAQVVMYLGPSGNSFTAAYSAHGKVARFQTEQE